MALTNYTDFVAEVASYSARTDLTTQIPTFVTFAQNRMSRDLRVNQMLKVVTTTATDGTVEKPSDFLELRELHFQGNPPITLEYESPDKFFRDQLTTTSGLPYYYTMLGQEFQFAPTPDSSMTLQMLYYAKPEYISSTVPSNLYLANYPDALLYATMAELEMYLMNDERVQSWSSLYDRAIANIMSNDDGNKYPNAALNVTLR